MRKESTVVRQDNALGGIGFTVFSTPYPYYIIENTVLLLHDIRHEIERQVCTQNSNKLAFRVVDGLQISYQRSFCIMSVEKGV